MRHTLLILMAVAMTASCGNKASQGAESTSDILDSIVGEFVSYDLDSFKLHVYNTRDVMRNSSYVIEGRDSLVVMEYPLFKQNATELAAYIHRLGKPVAADITDYHLGGSDTLPLTMPQGMAAFIRGPIYSGMMKNFAAQYGETMVPLPTQKTAEVPFGKTLRWAGVPFRFEHGAASDFPAATIIIGSQICYTHWAPSEEHASPFQISDTAALDAELAEAEEALATGARFFIGGHGGLEGKTQMEHRVAYLNKLKQLRATHSDAATFAKALREAYPKLKGDPDALAQALYDTQKSNP